MEAVLTGEVKNLNCLIGYLVSLEIQDQFEKLYLLFIIYYLKFNSEFAKWVNFG